MKKLLITLIITGLTSIFSVNALGQTTPGADRRQRNQRHRIKTGVGSGEITKLEAKSIRRSTTSAKRYEKRAKADGKVTWKERARLQRKENRSSRKIFRTKNNNRNRH